MFNRKQIPISDIFPDFQFPKFNKIKLADNITLYLFQNLNSTMASINFVINTGVYNETKNGLASLTSQMILKGTKTRQSQDIAEFAESNGIILNSYAGYDEVTLTSSSLPDYLYIALELISDCYLNFVFNSKEFSKLKNKQTALILQNNADINFLAQYGLMQTFYKDTGFAKPLTGSVSSIAEITKDDVCSYYSDILLKTPIDIIISGCFDENKIIDFTHKTIVNNKINSINNEIRILQLNHKTNAIVHKSDASQVVLTMARKTINNQHNDFPALHIINAIFGNFFMSRLNRILREQKGYTYGIHSIVESKKGLAVQLITTSINSNKAAESVRLIKKIYKDMIPVEITEEEIKTAKRHLIGYFLRSTETPHQIAGMVKSLVTFELPDDYYDNFYNCIIEANTHKLREVVKTHFAEENFSISTAGNINSLVKQMNKFGNLDIIEIEQ